MSVKETIKWIASYSDADDRARAVRESCLLDETDPQIADLMAHGATGSGQNSQLLKAMFVRPVKTTAAYRAKARVFGRVRQHNPATRPSDIVHAPVDEPKRYRSQEDFLPPQTSVFKSPGKDESHPSFKQPLVFDEPWDAPKVATKQVNPFRADLPAPRPCGHRC